jgi:hypothetical protein
MGRRKRKYCLKWGELVMGSPALRLAPAIYPFGLTWLFHYLDLSRRGVGPDFVGVHSF